MGGSSLTTQELGTVAQRERRTRILDATISLASQGGFDAVQMRDVAEGADVALGTLYRYFPSKVHLLVSALARELGRAEAATRDRRIPGTTPRERVMFLLGRTTRSLQGDPLLTEALVRAFMFADASVRSEIQAVGRLVVAMLTRAMDPTTSTPSAEQEAVARVIGDVWFSTLVGWVTGRVAAADVDDRLDVAVRLLTRPESA